MSYYPLLNYNWTDTSNNILPITNSYFAYGSLVNNIASLPSKQWGSLKVNTVSRSPAPSNIVDISGNALRFNITGIYEITTNLQFTDLTGPQTLGFSYSTALNDGSGDTINSTTNTIQGGIKCLDGSDNNSTLSVTPYFINGSSSGGGTNTFDTTNCGGNVLVISTLPFFILPNPSLSNINNINTVNSIYYIPANTDLYFNIANLVSATAGLKATGSFTVHLLNAMMPSVTTSSNLTISNLNFIKTGTGRGYYYYTFFPTNTTANGTATIQILTSTTINYLLVGGGGGGGGSYNVSGTYNAGGGGGGGQIKTGSITGGQITITVGNAGSSGVAAGNGGAGGNTVLNTIIATGGGGGANNALGGIGGGAAGGQGYKYLSSSGDGDQSSTSGGAGQSINISQIGLTYNVGGAGAGGGIGINNNGGGGGINNNGGLINGSTDYNGTKGTGYGTGGGGGGSYYNFTTSYLGGSGGSGFAVLYWEA